MGLKSMINREIKITLGVVSLVSLVFIAMSYAIFKVDVTGGTDVVQFGDISLAFCKDSTCNSTIDNIGNVIGTDKDENGNTVYSKIYPVSDPVSSSDWDSMSPYIFTLTNDGSMPLYISLYLEKDPTAGSIISNGLEYNEFVSDDEVNVAIGESGTTPTISLYSSTVDSDGNHKIASNILIAVGETKTFYLYAWLKSDALNASQGKYFVTQISAVGEYLPSGNSSDVDSDLKFIQLDLKNATADKNIKQVLVGESVEFTITPNEGYKLELDTNTCGGTLSGSTYTVSNVTNSKSCTVTLKKDGTTLYDKMLADNPTKSTRSSFSSTFTDNTTGTLYTATEANVHNTTATTVYYYAGNTTNNWVKFAGFYWRIIRTNADGSVRLLYSGTSHDTTSAYIGTSAYNTSYNDPMYVGYMYGISGDLVNNRTNTKNSTIKTVIDNWYASNLTAYTSYLSKTAVYCDDRELASGSTYSMTSTFYYAPNYRAQTSSTPTYNCTNATDAFSGSNSSAKLIYPIGLMTLDESMYAGGKFSNTLSSPYAWFYLNSSNESITGSPNWWLMTSILWYYNTDSDKYAGVFSLGGSSYPASLYYNYVDFVNAVRPVVSVKSDTVISGGTGTSTDPYVIN